LIYCALLTAAACAAYARVNSIVISTLIAALSSVLNSVTPMPYYLCVDGGHAYLCPCMIFSVLAQSRLGLPQLLLVISYFVGHMLLVYAWHPSAGEDARQPLQP
jgi:hypothetical protein